MVKSMTFPSKLDQFERGRADIFSQAGPPGVGQSLPVVFHPHTSEGLLQGTQASQQYIDLQYSNIFLSYKSTLYLIELYFVMVRFNSVQGVYIYFNT